jgi:hypothetical protein
MRYHKNHRPLNQSGFASLVIGIILVLVLGLLTVGYAQLVRSEQRSALDKQLSSQAYYAAESGVNDAMKALPTLTANKTSCGDTTPSQTSDFPMSVTSDGTVSYTCLLINLTPPSLVFDGLSSTETTSRVFSFDGGTLSALTISWSCDASSTTCTNNDRNDVGIGAANKLPPASNTNGPGGTCDSTTAWCNYNDVVQFTLTPLNGYDRQSLTNNEFSALLYPNQGFSPLGNSYYANSTSPTAQGNIYDGRCTSTGCSVTITGVPSASQYALSLRGLYGTGSDVTISATGVGGGALDFSGGQAIIDATGKAQDVLKRIQVRVPEGTNCFGGAGGGSCGPAAAIQAGNICKDLLISNDPGVTQVGTGSDNVAACNIDND